jgi:hypothetical protein
MAFDRSVRSFDRAGHLHVASANISKACVSPYLGAEIPDWKQMGLSPNRVYHLLRDPEELRRAASTFTGKPLVLKHRAQIASDHSRDITIGTVGEASWTAPYLRAPLVVWDGAGIAAIESGAQKQLSPGYFFEAVMTPGTFAGEPYDGRMANITGNHVALVPEGRQGPDVVVGDALPTRFRNLGKDSAMSDPAGGLIAGEQLNLRLIDAFREFLSGKLSPDDLAGFDALWMPYVSQTADADPERLAGDRRMPGAFRHGDRAGFEKRFSTPVPLKHL